MTTSSELVWYIGRHETASLNRIKRYLKTHPIPVRRESVEQMRKDLGWTQRDQRWVLRESREDGGEINTSFPLILTRSKWRRDKWDIIDGNHRFAVAVARGNKTVWVVKVEEI